MAQTIVSYDDLGSQQQPPIQQSTYAPSSTSTTVDRVLFMTFFAPGALFGQNINDSQHTVVPNSLQSVTEICNISIAQDADQIIEGLRQSMGLSISKIAELFQVTRPTIYAWKKEPGKPPLAAQKKLNAVAEVVSAWNKVCAGDDLTFLLSFRERSSKIPSILERLAEPAVDVDQVTAEIKTRVEIYRQNRAETDREHVDKGVERIEIPNTPISESQRRHHEASVKLQKMRHKKG